MLELISLFLHVRLSELLAMVSYPALANIPAPLKCTLDDVP